MQAVIDFFSYINGLGASVMMPIILTIFGVILGAKFGKALRGGLTVGVGFIGLNLGEYPKVCVNLQTDVR